MDYKFRKLWALTKILLLGLSFLLTSCFYSAKHVATYTVQTKNTEIAPNKLATNFINQLADKNSLSRDTKYNGIDTLAFFGRPYHYFKFWFEKMDTNTIVKFDYWGTFGNKKNEPYKDFFNEFDDFMITNFIIIEQDIKKVKHSKTQN